MIYLFSKVPFYVMSSNRFIYFEKNLFYQLEKFTSENFMVFSEGYYPQCISLDYNITQKSNSSLNIVKLERDVFLFLNFKKIVCPQFVQVKCGNLNICVSISNTLSINMDGESLIDEELDFNLKYSHYEQVLEYTLLYFTGEKNYIVVLKNKECIYNGFYDELNVDQQNRIFLNRKKDALNHGEIFKIENKSHEKYSVYLDDNPLNMKSEFTHLIFLDCLLVSNFKYCNQLLTDDLKQKNEKNIKNFFKEFNYYIPFKNFVFTFKKNTLSGVYKFEIKNCKIENIINLT